jgi:hypothetical protein
LYHDQTLSPRLLAAIASASTSSILDPYQPARLSNHRSQDRRTAYKTSSQIMESLKKQSLNGAIILIHAGVDPRRKDKFYNHLDELLIWLQKNGYRCVRLDELL